MRMRVMINWFVDIISSISIRFIINSIVVTSSRSTTSTRP